MDGRAAVLRSPFHGGSSLVPDSSEHRQVTPSSLADSSTLRQVVIRSTATRWNFREYRILLSLLFPLPESVAIATAPIQGVIRPRQLG